MRGLWGDGLQHSCSCRQGSPPRGSMVRAFLKHCSKPRNLMTLRVTVGWNLRPPLYGPSVLENWTR